MPETQMPEIAERAANLHKVIARSTASLQRLTKARDMIQHLGQDIPTRDWIKTLRKLLSDDHKAHQETVRCAKV
jgi:hypothetical protein